MCGGHGSERPTYKRQGGLALLLSAPLMSLPLAVKIVAWSPGCARALLGDLAEGVAPQACAQVMGWITVRLIPVQWTPEVSFRHDTFVGVISAVRFRRCWTGRQEPSVV